MNNKDLLDILGEIDEELVEDAAPSEKREEIGKSPAPKKIGFAWVKPLSIAAGFVLIICGVLASKPLFDRINSPNLVDPEETDESQGEFWGDVNESPNDGDVEDAPFEEGVGGDDNNSEGSASGETPPLPPEYNVSGGEDNKEDFSEEIDEGFAGEPMPELGFASLIDELGALDIYETVRYNTTIPGAPKRYKLEANLLEGIAGVLYICDGEPVYGLSAEDLGAESVVLEHEGENSVGFEVHKNGYIAVNCIYYYVGEEYTEKIIEIVKTEGKADY